MLARVRGRALARASRGARRSSLDGARRWTARVDRRDGGARASSVIGAAALGGALAALASAQRAVAAAEDDLYAALGVGRSATAAEIKSAYKKAAVKHHPDKGGDEAAFRRVARAYEVLSDPEQRRRYDAHGEAGLGGGGGGGGGGFGGGGGGGGFGGGFGGGGFGCCCC